MDEATIKRMVQEAIETEMTTRLPLFRRYPEAIEADIRCAAEGHPDYGNHGCVRCFAPRPRAFESSEPVVVLTQPRATAHRPGSDPADCEWIDSVCSCWS